MFYIKGLKLKKITISALFCALAISTSPCSANSNHNITDEIVIKDQITKIRTYKSKDLSPNPKLVITIHGDAPFHNPSYQYLVAKSIASKTTDTISIGILRPGYTDNLNRTSSGVKGDVIGDNYDKKRVSQIADVIQALKQYYKASTVIVAGHSGGGAITANMIAMYPALINTAFIVSCPCNINDWRKDMYKLTDIPVFNGDLDVVSPVDIADYISEETDIVLISGRDDKQALPYLSQEYQKALVKKGKHASFRFVEGEHNIMQSEEVIETLVNILDKE